MAIRERQDNSALLLELVKMFGPSAQLDNQLRQQQIAAAEIANRGAPERNAALLADVVATTGGRQAGTAEQLRATAAAPGILELTKAASRAGTATTLGKEARDVAGEPTRIAGVEAQTALTQGAEQRASQQFPLQQRALLGDLATQARAKEIAPLLEKLSKAQLASVLSSFQNDPVLMRAILKQLGLGIDIPASQGLGGAPALPAGVTSEQVQSIINSFQPQQ